MCVCVYVCVCVCVNVCRWRGYLQNYIDVTHVPDLNAVTVSSTGITVGASVSLKQLIAICHAQDAMSPTFSNDPSTETVRTATSSYAALARHLLKVAGQQVRSVGSWAGNLMLATHYHDFPSDVVLVSDQEAS